MNELEMMEKIEVFFYSEIRKAEKDYAEFVVNGWELSRSSENDIANDLNEALEALNEISVMKRMKKKLIASLKEG